MANLRKEAEIGRMGPLPSPQVLGQSIQTPHQHRPFGGNVYPPPPGLYPPGLYPKKKGQFASDTEWLKHLGSLWHSVHVRKRHKCMICMPMNICILMLASVISMDVGDLEPSGSPIFHFNGERGQELRTRFVTRVWYWIFRYTWSCNPCKWPKIKGIKPYLQGLTPFILD